MTDVRNVEVFSAGCPLCEEGVRLVSEIAGPSCKVTVLDMRDPEVSERARRYGVRSLPAVAVNGVLAACCRTSGLDENALRAAGIGLLL